MRAELKDICDQTLALKSLQPKNGVTYCNIAVQTIAAQMGCDEFSGLMADEIYQVMATNVSGKWKGVDASDAAIWALSNGLSIASLPSQRLGESHGHVAVVYPVGQQYSPSFDADVPMLANVGKSVGILKSSEVFPVSKGMPDFFTFAG
jgi:hypothetical protein